MGKWETVHANSGFTKEGNIINKKFLTFALADPVE
jgi:hypothetical protein